MRIFVTGAEGTLGPWLVNELRRRGHTVFGCDLKHSNDPQIMRADVADFRQMYRAISEANPDVVYHLAAEFGRENGREYPEQLWRTNCLGTRTVVQLCAKNNVPLIFASSSEAYGDADAYAPNEPFYGESLLEKNPPDFHNEYALTKWTNERQIRLAARHEGLRAVILRFFNAYGPGEYYSPYRSVVCLFCYRLMFGLPITVYSGYHRVFMWVGDWANTVSNAAELAVTHQRDLLAKAYVPTMNIGGEEYLSVKELKDRIVALLGGTKSKIKYLDAEKANVCSKRPDNRLARELLGHDPEVTLDLGLPQTIAWLRAVYDERGLLRSRVAMYSECTHAVHFAQQS